MEIVVIGTGRIGAVAACCLADAGHKVTGIGIDTDKLELVNPELVPYLEPELARLLKRGLQTGNLQEVCLNDRADGNSRASYNLAGEKVEI